MSFSIPTLPSPVSQNGLNNIPPPSPELFDSEFGGLLPPGITIPSSWGLIRYYIFTPTSTPTGRNIILIHGGGTPALGLASLAHALASKGENVVAYDLWGHGCSSTPLAPQTSALFHHQLLELLSDLQWTSAHTIGYSLGGSIVATFAATHPKAVVSLVLVAPAGLVRKSDRSWWDAFIEDGGRGREWLAQRKIIDAIEGLNAKPQEGWKERLKNGEVDGVAVETWERENHAGHVANIVGTFRHGGVFDMHEAYGVLAKSEVRKLVVLGGADDFFREEMMRRELEGVGWKEEVKVVEGAGHGVARTHVGEVVKILEDFWSD